MRCPKCCSVENRVVDSRPTKTGSSIRRRRECDDCSHRFSTLEDIIREDIVVIKNNGTREDFDRTKLMRGISRALEKRPVSREVVELMVQEITAALQRNFESEIPSTAIGDEVMKRLRSLDKIAYVRFASVYKDFQDVSQLEQEIYALKE